MWRASAGRRDKNDRVRQLRKSAVVILDTGSVKMIQTVYWGGVTCDMSKYSILETLGVMLYVYSLFIFSAWIGQLLRKTKDAPYTCGTTCAGIRGFGGVDIRGGLK